MAALKSLFLTLRLSLWALTDCKAIFLIMDMFCPANPFLALEASSLNVTSIISQANLQVYKYTCRLRGGQELSQKSDKS